MSIFCDHVNNNFFRSLRRSNQENSLHNEPEERTNPDILIDVTSSYINLPKDSAPNDPDPKVNGKNANCGLFSIVKAVVDWGRGYVLKN